MAETRATDLIVLVDDHDEPVGAISKRELGRRPGLHFRTAHVFLFDSRRRLLLQRLARERERNPLHWGSSIAAYVHAGESYRDAAVRRAREELGLDIQPDLVGKTQMPDLGGVKHIALFASGAEEETPPRILESAHIAEIRWFSLEQISELMRTHPQRFTETFLFLFSQFYRDGRFRRASAG